jgi:hypothetical protein
MTKLKRGALMASWTSMPKALMFVIICVVVCGMVRPPGVPRATTGRPSRRTIVGQSAYRVWRPA